MSGQETQIDKSEARVKAMFNEIAPRYDFLNNLLSVGLAPQWRRRAVRRILSSVESDRARAGVTETLDVATGTGDMILELRRRWESLARKDATRQGELKTIGVDFSSEMLALARRKAPGVEFVECDGCDLPFDADRFDAVTIAFGLRNMRDPSRGVAEMGRVCRRGGTLAILEFSKPRFPIFAPLFRFYFHRVLPQIGQRVMKNTTEAYKYLPESVDSFDSPERVLEYMRASGFSNARRYPMTFGVLGLFIGQKE